LSAFYEVAPILSPLDARFLANFAVLAALLAFTVGASCRRALSLFCWFWFYSGLGPVMNLIATSLLMQDRYVYLALPAFWVIVALAAEGLWERLRACRQPREGSGRDARCTAGEDAGATTRGRDARCTAGEDAGATTRGRDARATTVCVWSVLVVLAALGAWRSGVWDNAYVLFRDAVRKQPRSVLANLCFGNTLATLADNLEAAPGSQDRLAEIRQHRHGAEYYYQHACVARDFKRLPSPGMPYLNLALVQEKSGQLDDAAATLQTMTTRRFDPPVVLEDAVTAHQRLAAIRLRQDRPSDALTEIDQALVLAPDAAKSWLLAGQIFEALRRPADALTAYGKVKPGTPERAAAAGAIRRLSGPPGR
jgi:tetratricopeptide (TPR) repeat protein